MNDHPLGLDCDALGECSHWQHHTDPAEWQRATEAARRHQTAKYALHLLYTYDREWKAFNRHPLLLNEGTPRQEPFTVALALSWARRIAEVELA